MYSCCDDKPKLKSLAHRKWLILRFWLCIIGAILSAIYTFFMFFEDIEVFLVMMLVTMNCLYRAYLYEKAFNGFDDWEYFKYSRIDIDELFEIADMEEGEEKKRRQEEVEKKDKEYDRIWKITWKLKLLKRKEELYLKKTEKKKAKFEKKKKKLEQEMIPRCEGIKL